MCAVASAGGVARGEVDGVDEVEELGEVEVKGEVGESKPELPGDG